MAGVKAEQAGIVGRWFGRSSARAVEAESDGALLRRAKRGDEAACRELLDRHGARLMGVVQKAHHDLGQTEDVVQETFVRAIQEADRLRSDGAVFPWLVRIALNVAVDLRRRTQRETVTDELPEMTTSIESSADRRMERVEDADRVNRALARLKPRARELLVLRYFAGMSVAELAEVFDKSDVAVRKDLQRARDQLRRHLVQWFSAEGIA